MCEKLSFGTAGVRCRMEAGFGRLNDLTIIQLSHGFAKHLKNNDSVNKKVIIGFDARHNSKRFAELAANVFVCNNIKVFFFTEYVPTPVVSFAITKLNGDAGLMITASHNPKDDNGYKAYWKNGAQILSPHDVEICRIAYEELELRLEYWDTSKLFNSNLIQSADIILDEYFESESQMCYLKEINKKSSIKFTYSAFHGVGSKFAHRLLLKYNIPEENIIHVKEQDEPNPDFPTVKYPNPEEGLSVLKNSIETAENIGSTVILANDPDADRLQLAEKQKNGHWKIFTGNEMGTILTWWIWKNWKKKNQNIDFSNVYIINSAVSSQIVKTMAEIEGFKNVTTLTGFKWMGNLIDDLRKQKKTVILAWEESIGFLAGHTLDKDGVSAAAIFAEIANYLNIFKKNSLLSDQLFKIYEKYGFHLVRSSYWIVPYQSITKQIFEEIRKFFPKKIGDYDVKYIRDLTNGYDNSQPNNKAILPLNTSSEMITITLNNGSIATIRASGTEPKIKYYIELKTEPGKRQQDLKNILIELEELEKNVVTTLLNPIKFKLIPRLK